VISVVLADDNPVIRQGVAGLLEAQADDITIVAQAATGQEAVSAVRAHDPDVVLLDVRMPVMDGIAAAAELAGLRARVLMLTYSDDEVSVTEAVRAGADGYLVHGRFEPEELADAVRNLAAGRTVISPAVAPVVFDALRRAPASDGTLDEEEGGAFSLTAREREIMGLVARGLSNREIAGQLVLSEKTVKNHVQRAYVKLGVNGRAQAVARWLGSEGPGQW